MVGQDGVVVDLARHRDLVLGLGELGLQVEEVLVGLQVGVGLGDREQPAERLGEEALGGAGLGRGLRARGRRARLGDLVERAALVGRVALHGLDEVRDQVAPPAQLHVDLRPGVVDAVALLDEPVVEHDQVQREQHQHDDHRDQQPGHGATLDGRRVQAA